jgi:hypothetical protein
MGIEIRIVGNGPDAFGFGGPLYAPLILCDHCGQPIARGEGGYVWGDRWVDGVMEATAIKFFHKKFISPACAAAWDRYERQVEWMGYSHSWMDVDDFVVFLANNIEGNDERDRRAGRVKGD